MLFKVRLLTLVLLMITLITLVYYDIAIARKSNVPVVMAASN